MPKVEMNEDAIKAMQVMGEYAQVLNNEQKRVIAVRLLLASMGENLCREGLLDTPDRVAKMYEEIFAGYQQFPGQLLATGFDEENHEEMVIVKDIPFYSHCEHHMVPFFGVAHIAYIPQGRVVGISKLARLVECYAKRLQIQERMSSNIADDIMSYLDAKGAAVIIEAEHLCMTMRGVKKPGARTTTSAMRGVFRENNHNARLEFLSLIK